MAEQCPPCPQAIRDFLVWCEKTGYHMIGYLAGETLGDAPWVIIGGPYDDLDNIYWDYSHQPAAKP